MGEIREKVAGTTPISKDVRNTFKGREELAFRIFAYGTHYVYEGK